MSKMMDLAKGILEAYGRGEGVYDYLASQGSKNPSAYWYQIKQTVKLKDPDLYEQLSVIRTDNRKKATPQRLWTTEEAVKEAEKAEKAAEEAARAVTTCCAPAPPSGVTVPDELPEETVEFNGKEYERMKPKESDDGYKKVAETAREMLDDIRTAKDAKPIYPIGEEEMVFSVKKMNSRLGTWEYNREKDQYIFAANKFDDQLNVLALDIKDWLNLAAEIPKALRKMTDLMT